MKTCRLCRDIEHLAKDCPKTRRQQDFSQCGAQSQGKPQGQSGSPPSSQSDTKNGASHTTQEELMDTQSSNASVRNEINITEPDPDVLKSRMDDVFGGSVSTDP